MAIRHVHDALVIELAVQLEHRDEYCVLAVLLAPVLVELGEMRLVGPLVGGRELLVLHLEHDRDELGAVIVALTVDEVTLGAAQSLVVLLEADIAKGLGIE